MARAGKSEGRRRSLRRRLRARLWAAERSRVTLPRRTRKRRKLRNEETLRACVRADRPAAKSRAK